MNFKSKLIAGGCDETNGILFCLNLDCKTVKNTLGEISWRHLTTNDGALPLCTHTLYTPVEVHKQFFPKAFIGDA